KLAESEEKYRKLFNNAPFAIVLFSLDGIILDCNDSTKRITGYSKEDLIGKNFKDFNFYVEPDSANIKEREDQVKNGKIPAIRDILLKKEDGSEFWAKNQIEFVNLGDITYIQAIIQDVSEEKLAQIKLNKSENLLKERLKELNCLYELSKIGERLDLSLNDIMHEFVNLIQNAWQFPELICAHISFEGKNYTTENFNETSWLLDTQVEINKKPLIINVYYLQDNPFSDEEKDLLREIGIRVKDILERKESEERLRESEEKFRNIFETIPDLFFQVSSDTTIIDYKGTLDDLYAPPEDFLGKEITDILPHDLAEISLNCIRKTLDTHKPQIAEYSLNMRGELRFFEARYLYFSEDNVLVFIRDITERRKAEDNLLISEKNAKDAFDRANFYKDLFAHDMNNILQVINSSAELISYQLGDSEKSKDIANIAGIIKKQVERGAKLISNVRTLSELEEKKIITTKTQIKEYLMGSIDFVKKTYEDRNLNISIDGIKDDHFTNGNELLQDVFENVLINGIKYNENANIEIAIEASEQKIDDKNYFRLEFKDNGIGVEDARKEVIFKSGNRQLKGSKGMGLGLSLVSKILEIFKAKIWVEDRVQGLHGKGSNFIIMLTKTEDT
ncbi:MAG: PAS domain S-box protein, partial [Promethearchaeota archaeon]